MGEAGHDWERALCYLRSTRVRLKRWRHWEGDKSVVERCAITLDIKPG